MSEYQGSSLIIKLMHTHKLNRMKEKKKSNKGVDTRRKQFTLSRISYVVIMSEGWYVLLYS